MAKTQGKKPARTGANGQPMTVWQVWLRRLCFVLIAWASVVVVCGIVLAAFSLFSALPSVFGVDVGAMEYAIGGVTFAAALLNLVIGIIGVRGAEDPGRMALFFWIVLVDAVLTAWSLASSVSYGFFDPTSIVSGLFIILLAVCAWQVRGQTGYFEQHP